MAHEPHERKPGLSAVPYDILIQILETLVASIGVREALILRLICKAWKSPVEGVIGSLLIHAYSGSGPPPSPMPTSIVTQLILRVCRADDASERPLCHAIEQVVQLSGNSDWSLVVPTEECRYNLAAAAANSLFLVDIIRNLHPQPFKAPESSQSLSKQLIAAAGKLERSQLESIDDLASPAVLKTRFFGCALSSVARLGMREVMSALFDRLDLSKTDLAQTKSLDAAIEQAAANNQPGIIDIIVSRVQGTAVSVSYEVAIGAAVRSQHEDIALSLLHRQRLSPEGETRIWHLAAAYGCGRVLESLLRTSSLSKVDTDTINTSLEAACRYDQAHIIRLLCQAQPTSFAGALFWSAYHGSREILGILRQAGFSEIQMIDALAGAFSNEQLGIIDQIFDLSTPQSATVTGGFVEATHLVLDGKRDVRFCYKRSKPSPLSVIYRADTYEYTLSEVGWDPTIPHPTEPDLVWQACESRSFDGVRKAIAAFRETHPHHTLNVFSAPCSEATRTSQVGLLYYLSQLTEAYILPDFVLESKSTALMHVFFALGWDVNWATSIASPPLLGHVFNDEYLTRFLLQAGANPNARCRWDYTPTSYAMANASMEVIKLLFSWGADIRYGQLLHFAMWREKQDVLELVDLLLSLGADIDAIQYKCDERSWSDNYRLGLGTPLHYAAARGNHDLVEHLLARQANRSIRDSLGRLPQDVARSEGHMEIAVKLELNLNV